MGDIEGDTRSLDYSSKKFCAQKVKALNSSFQFSFPLSQYNPNITPV